MNQPGIDASLRQLCELLGVDCQKARLLSLSPKQLGVWKPLAEQMAFDHKPQTTELINLLVQVAEATGDQAVLGLALWIVGNMYHNLGAMKEAHVAYERAASVYVSIGDEKNCARMTIGWIHVLGELGEYEQAFTRATSAASTLAASKSAKDSERLAKLYNNVGIVYERTGQLAEALTHYERCWQFYRSRIHTHSTYLSAAALVLNDMAIVQTLLGQYSHATKTFDTALTLLQHGTDAEEDRVTVATLLTNRAWMSTLKESDHQAVRQAFHQAHESRLRLETINAAHFVFLDLTIASWLIRTGCWQEVDGSAIDQLAALAAEAGISTEVNFARLLHGQLAYYADALQAAYTTFSQVEYDAVSKSPTLVYLAQMWQARVLHKRGNLPAAKETLGQAIQQIERTRQLLTTDDYRAGYLQDKLVAYQDLIRLHLDTWDFGAAFAVSEQAKARTLTEALATRYAERHSPILDATASYAAIEKVATAIPSDTIAVSYAVLHGEVWAYLITQNGFLRQPLTLGPAPNPQELEYSLRTIQLRSATAAARRITQGTLQTLFDKYIAPLQASFAPYEHLLISPDSQLHALPFACLYDPQQHEYLINQKKITITPSLAIWSSLAVTRVLPSAGSYQNALIIGNPAKNGKQGELPHTVHEAQAVAACFESAQLLLEGEATFQRFVELTPEAEFIYVAAHGEYRDGEPASSFIELADRHLRVADILQLKLKRPTVVLSACESSRGYLTGNEMMGLVRAFLYAGAKAVVATHWQVEDDAMDALMMKFVQELRRGSSLARSLQYAQCAFISATQERISHPYYWGALSVFGADR